MSHLVVPFSPLMWSVVKHFMSIAIGVGFGNYKVCPSDVFFYLLVRTSRVSLVFRIVSLLDGRDGFVYVGVVASGDCHVQHRARQRSSHGDVHHGRRVWHGAGRVLLFAFAADVAEYDDARVDEQQRAHYGDVRVERRQDG